MGIRDRPVAPRSPWQNGYAERVIGSIRRDLLDHVVILNQRHLRKSLHKYADDYNGYRTHLGLAKDTPFGRIVQAVGRIIAIPQLTRRSVSPPESVAKASGSGTVHRG